eukprot:754874-Hanusia_phi.AAC.2
MAGEQAMAGKFWLDLSKSHDRDVLELLTEDEEGVASEVRLLQQGTAVCQIDRIGLASLQETLTSCWAAGG